jgi:hypothetical protein
MIIKNKAAVATFVAGVVVAGGGVAAAAEHSLILGDTNGANATTGLKNTGTGPVLKLTGPRSAAPLAVNSGKKVANLNADKLDNLDSAALALRSGRTGTVIGQGVNVDVDDDGAFDVFVAVATCPAGTVVTGGGFENFTAFSEAIAEATPENDGWWVVTNYDAANSPDDLVASAQCYNPRGAVATVSPRPAASKQLSPAQRAALVRVSERSR